MIAVDVRYRGELRRIYAKHESLSLTGSVKDRMALFVLEDAYRNGRIHPGDRIVEATSGNTGISFAAIGRALGHPVTIFMPDWMTAERMTLIASFGADVVPVSREQGAFSAASSASKHRRNSIPACSCRISSRTRPRSTGANAGHKNRGHHSPGGQLHPDLRARGFEVRAHVGISDFMGALKAQTALCGDATTVTIFRDSNKKYLSTDLMRREPTRHEYESPHVEIVGYEESSLS